MSERVWFYVEAEAQKGPVSQDELVALLRQLPRDTLVWREGMADWLPAADVKELAVRPAPPPPAPAPPPPPPAPSRVSSAPRLSAPAAPSAPAPGPVAAEETSYNPLVLWRRCFSWGGRFDRGEFAVAYFGMTAVMLGALFCVGLATAVLSGGAGREPSEAVQMLIGAGVVLTMPITILIGIGAAVRRLHDMGQTGWLALLMLVPCLNFVMVVFLVAVPGNQGSRPSSGGSSAPVIVIAAAVGLFAVVPIIGIVAAIAIPSLLRARIAANEAGAVGDIRTVISAEAAYQSANGGYYGTITCLATPAGCISGYTGPSMLDATLAQQETVKNGYRRQWFELPSRARRGAIDQFCYSAVPAAQGQTGNRSFGGDSSGMVGASPIGAACCSERGLDLNACPPLH